MTEPTGVRSVGAELSVGLDTSPATDLPVATEPSYAALLVLALLVGSLGAWITATPLAFTNFQWFLWSCVGLAVATRRDRTPRIRPQGPD